MVSHVSTIRPTDETMIMVRKSWKNTATGYRSVPTPDPWG